MSPERRPLTSTHPTRLPILLIATLPWINAIPIHAAGMAWQRMTVRLSVPALPEPLRTFFNERQQAVIERALEPGTVWHRSPERRDFDQWSYLALDAAAPSNETAVCLAASRSFPRDANAARVYFRRHGIARGGRLPWICAALVEDLAAAFAAGDDDAIVAATGYLAHFAAQAADPFNATRNRRGAETGNVDFGNHRLGDPLHAHQDVAHRFGCALVRRNAERYRQTLSGATFQYALGTPPRDLVFETLQAGLASVGPFCAADRDIFERTQLSTDGRRFLARADAYYVLLDERCGAASMDNLLRGARLACALVYSAWQSAGAPDPLTAARSPDAGPGPHAGPASSAGGPIEADPSPATSEHWVGSRNSSIYHRADCPHAARINPENRIKVVSQDELAGRRPCKTCMGNRAGPDASS